MNYTQNYQLPQWEREDRILMEDFNDMAEKVDTGLAAAEERASTSAEVLASAALSADSRSIALDVSALDLSQYRQLRLVLWGRGSGLFTSLHLRANDVSTNGQYLYRDLSGGSSYASDSILLGSAPTTSGSGVVADAQMYTWEGHIYLTTHLTGYDGANAASAAYSGAILVCGFDGLEKLTVTIGYEPDGASSRLLAGSQAVLLGYRF